MVVAFALIITLLWIAGTAYYLVTWVGLENVSQFLPNEIGDFSTGFFAPLAFFWLVVAVLLQRRELRLQRLELRQTNEAVERQADQLRKAAEQTRDQAVALRESERHVRRDLFLRLYDMVTQELNAAAMALVANARSTAHASPPVDASALWSQVAHGDKAAIFRALHTRLRDEAFLSALEKDCEADPETRSLISDIVDQVDRLVEQADRCDAEQIMRTAVLKSDLGASYAILNEKFAGKKANEQH